MNAPVKHNAKDFFSKPMVQEKLKELVGKSELTGKTYKGFSVHTNGYGFWLLKMEVKQ